MSQNLRGKLSCNFTIVNMQLIPLCEKKIDNFYHNLFGATFHLKETRKYALFINKFDCIKFQ